MLRNARIEYAEEAKEIATYTVIDALATTAGDTETAKLAREILREEERMQKFLAKLIPELTANVAHDEIPVSELPKAAVERRVAPDQRRAGLSGHGGLRPDASFTDTGSSRPPSTSYCCMMRSKAARNRRCISLV